MTSRERVLAALNHTEPDRVPYDQGTTMVTGIHRIAYERLVEALGIEGLPPTEILDPVQQLAMPHERVLEALGVDTRSVYLRLPGRTLGTTWSDNEYLYAEDEWGILRRMPRDGGLYYDQYHHPLAGAESVADVEVYAWPDPLAGLDLDAVTRAVEAIRAQGNYPVIVGGYGSGMLELVMWLQGYDQGYMNLLVGEEITHAILDRVVELKIAYVEKLLGAVGPQVDIFYNGDDVGLQEGPMLRPEWFDRFLRPRYMQYHQAVKRLAPGAKMFFHSCGSVYEVLPALIETGIDIINPVQVSAAEMGDTARLKREFGDAVSFWGGIDTQRVLPHGTPAQVRDEVRRRIDDLAPGGGYVLNSVHNIQADVPPQNIIAMMEALDEYGYY
ncbi:MAG TPA: uroporphyrinogen decarboxylase family protein [Armatimonadota bacterium]|nr:uroporphyrinogen decarboxylase family protein [Armatimonadota bacterium]